MLNFAQLQRVVQKIFTNLPSPDHGWWLITRDHIAFSELVTACQYFFTNARRNFISLSSVDYNQLHQALGRKVPMGGAGQTLRRHLLLNMMTPLGLIERRHPNKWDKIRLTKAGQQIAQGYLPALILEQRLRQIKFAKQPWSPPDRVERYSAFSVSPHHVLLTVLRRTSGYLDRHEYRLFVAHQRNHKNMKIVIQNILSFRNLSHEQQKKFLNYERKQFGNAKKKYSNWSDMDLHTFSLMSLGTSFVRVGHELRLTQHIEARPQHIVIEESTNPLQIVIRRPLASPVPPTPPSPPIQANTGYDAEMLVASLLRAEGFEVFDYTRTRGYGFDLWIKHFQTGDIFFVEVKSSQSQLSSLTLTALEFQAAQQYGENYLLFIIEELRQPNPNIWVVQNPVQQIPNLAQPRRAIEYRSARSSWLAVSKPYNS